LDNRSNGENHNLQAEAADPDPLHRDVIGTSGRLALPACAASQTWNLANRCSMQGKSGHGVNKPWAETIKAQHYLQHGVCASLLQSENTLFSKAAAQPWKDEHKRRVVVAGVSSYEPSYHGGEADDIQSLRLLNK
jgi:hypothetical protein